jgi:tRNA A37 threonylcarbamoyladenosine modification protein TsaB
LQKALHNRLQSVELLVIGVASPLLVGVYENGLLINSFESKDKTSKALPKILDEISKHYNLAGLYYAKGPGSFMAIKVTYVMLKTFSIALKVPLLACDAFIFNGNKPIKAVGKSCFIKKDGDIIVQKNCSDVEMNFKLPDRLDRACFNGSSEPLYILPAV